MAKVAGRHAFQRRYKSIYPQSIILRRYNRDCKARPSGLHPTTYSYLAIRNSETGAGLFEEVYFLCG